MDLQLLIGLQGELLQTSIYDLQHTNHRATVGLHLTWPYYYGHGGDITMGPGKVRFPDPDQFTIANTFTERITTHLEL
jgi:hypothetical protein